MTNRDQMKAFEEISLPDVRQAGFALYNTVTGESQQITLKARYQMIERYSLHEDVPDSVATQYQAFSQRIDITCGLRVFDQLFQE